MSTISPIDDIKSSIATAQMIPCSGSSYVRYCQVCGLNGFPHRKIIMELEGFRSEEEEGFAYKFTEYDYNTTAGEKRNKHSHKYNPKLIQEFVDLALKGELVLN